MRRHLRHQTSDWLRQDAISVVSLNYKAAVPATADKLWLEVTLVEIQRVEDLLLLGI